MSREFWVSFSLARAACQGRGTAGMEIAHVRVSPLGVAGPHSSKMASTALSRRPLLCRHWAPATESTSDKKTLSHPTHPPVGASTRRTSRRHSERVTGSRTHAKALSPEQRRLAPDARRAAPVRHEDSRGGPAIGKIGALAAARRGLAAIRTNVGACAALAIAARERCTRNARKRKAFKWYPDRRYADPENMREFSEFSCTIVEVRPQTCFAHAVALIMVAWLPCRQEALLGSEPRADRRPAFRACPHGARI